jgi:hypothetical protein
MEIRKELFYDAHYVDRIVILRVAANSVENYTNNAINYQVEVISNAMWDILLNVLIGAAAGYAAYKVVEALLPMFVSLWESFVEAVEEIFGYITEATKDFLAGVAKYLQDQWSEVKSFLREHFGYISKCVVFLFQQAGEAFMGFANPANSTQATPIVHIGPVQSSEIQLPEQQPIAHELWL